MGLAIKFYWHGVFTGKSQGGKSHAVKFLFYGLPRAIFYDFKHDRSHNHLLLDYPLATTPKALHTYLKKGKTHIVYRPPPAGSLDEAIRYHEQVCKIIYEMGNIALIDDEAAQICNDKKMGRFHHMLLTLGMARGIGVISCTQQPVNVATKIFSEAKYMVMFQTLLESHRKKIAGTVGKTVAESLLTLPEYYFIFWRDNCTATKPMKLPGPKVDK